VDINSRVAKRMFKAHSSMSWNTLKKEVSKYLDGAVLLLQPAYKLSGGCGQDIVLEG
jgi:hypothetical protein